MSLFWGLAATLALVAVAFIVPPLLGRSAPAGSTRERINAAIYRERLAELEHEFANPSRSREDFDAAKADIFRNLADETRVPDASRGVAGSAAHPISAVVLAAALPLAALIGYLALGKPEVFLGTQEIFAPGTRAGPGQAQPGAATNPSLPSIQNVVANLEQRLTTEPSNVKGWILLSRSYDETEQPKSARSALDRGLLANPGNPDLLVAQAEMIGRLRGNQLTGEPLALLYDGLRSAPEHRKGLWLAGIGELQSAHPAKALALWDRLRTSGPMEDEDAQLLERFVAEAQNQLSAAGGEAHRSSAPPRRSATRASGSPAPAAGSPEGTAASGARISVTVTLSATFASTASPQDTVFVFARAAEGPRMPLAIERRTVSELPITLHLDDSMAMMPALKLSSFADIVVGARVSKSGNALPAPGDLFGEVGPVTHAERSSVVINIDKIIP